MHQGAFFSALAEQFLSIVVVCCKMVTAISFYFSSSLCLVVVHFVALLHVVHSNLGTKVIFLNLFPMSYLLCIDCFYYLF
jgi:hypothetical protein